MLVEPFIEYEDIKYPEVITQRDHGYLYKYVPYNIKENNGVYSWIYFNLRPCNYNYKDMVDFIIGMKYSLRESMVIMCNYMAEPENENYKKEFEEYQQCRKEAKDFAKKHFNLI